MAVVFAGGSVGVIVTPFIVQAIIIKYTITGLLLIMAGLFLNLLIVSGLLSPIEINPPIDGIDEEVILDEEVYSDDHPMNNYNNNIHETDSMNTNKEVVVKKNKCKGYLSGRNTCKLLLTPKCCLLILYYITYVFGVYGHLRYIPLYAAEVGATPAQIPVLLSIFGAMNLVSLLSVGFITNFPRINIYILIAVNSVIVGCFDLLVPLIIQSGPAYVVLMVNMATVGMLVGGLFTLIGQLVVDAVGIHRAGTGIGLASAGIGIAQIIPPLIYGKYGYQI